MKLIIGRRNFHILEQFVSGDDSPEQIRKTFNEIYGVTFDEDEPREAKDIKYPHKTIVTFSQTVIDYYERVFRNENDRNNIDTIFLYYEDENDKHLEGKEYRLTQFIDKAWLVHFSIGDLYADNTLTEKLKEYLRDNPKEIIKKNHK